ncbi:aminopeptidase P family protein [Aureispira anguillae]|uniref:Xaa-Pro aminopeptidase n=1 Tax=Aureispira anguillae TaxID=2864201 RepID=A0A916DS46_9BACT|nr:aminopeptidase P family protein [Aureispira anguillae]BDS12279.1 aminopeptidase P family protein [Aureispira anguillae]
MKYNSINPALFIENRKRFAAKMKPNSIAIIHANDMMSRNGDCHFAYRQSSDLFYLTGLDQEEVILVLYPDCPRGDKFKEIIFTKQTNEHIAVWEGYKYTKEDAAQTSGINTVYWLDEMQPLFNELILLADNIYVNTNENDRAVMDSPSRDVRHALQLKQEYVGHNFERAQPIFKSLRMIKSSYEIDLMQKACDITNSAFRRVLATTQPGMMEYEVEANVIYEFTRQGSSGHAYTPIIAGGKNACVLHYIANDMKLNDGDLLLMDFGAEYANYASDMTRTIPVNGKFTARQKAVYNAVLNVKKEAEKILVAGNNLLDYHKEVGRIMEGELIGLGLLDKKDVLQQNANAPLYKKYFMHGTSHHLGLDVHDLCHRYVDFEEGMVFTCEPGIYIPEENIGIRIEDDLVVTNGQPLNLMSNIPIEVEEIEELMNSEVVV